MIFLLVTFLDIVLIVEDSLSFSICIKTRMLADLFSRCEFSSIDQMTITIPSLIGSVELSVLII